MSALQWCSPVGELLTTAWSRPGVRLSRLPAAPVVSRLTPSLCVWGWQMWARDPALYVTRAYKKLPIKHGELYPRQIDTRMTNVCAGFLETFNRQEYWVIWPYYVTSSNNQSVWVHIGNTPLLWIIGSPCECFEGILTQKETSLCLNIVVCAHFL